MRGQTMLQVTNEIFSAPPRKPPQGARAPPYLGRPPRSRAEKEKKVTEEIKTHPTAGEPNVAVPSRPQGPTGRAPG